MLLLLISTLLLQVPQYNAPHHNSGSDGLLYKAAVDYALWPQENVIFFLQQMNEPAPGHVTFHLPDGKIYMKEAVQGSSLEDLSAALDLLTENGADDWVNIAPNGQWFVMSTERFDARCDGWACLATADGTMDHAGVVILTNGDVVHQDGSSAISSDGNTIVFPATNDAGPHTLDLWVIHKSGTSWSLPQNITSSSSYNWNQEPAISPDGTKIVFSAGAVPYAMEGTVICEVAVDGNDFQVLFTPEQGPGGTATNALKSPDYAPDGSVVFEADWTGEQVWRLDRQTGIPSLVNASFGNDNSPCVLPDGRIVSLWLDSGIHEIKIMNADGTSYFMLFTGIDVDDIGLGCSE